MKNIETMIIEKILLNDCFGSNPKLAKEYGTTEVTIGFQRNNNEKEIVDFMSYNARKDIFRCYEIKTSMQDFHSSAKKSWHGNYNYLVLSNELFEKLSLEDWKKNIPTNVGIIVVNPATREKETVLNARYRDISSDIKDILKQSLIRTLFYQNTRKNWYLRD